MTRECATLLPMVRSVIVLAIGGMALACSSSGEMEPPVGTEGPGGGSTSASTSGSSSGDEAAPDASSSEGESGGPQPVLSVLPPCGVLGLRMEYAVQVVGNTDYYVDEITNVTTAATGELVSTWTRTNVAGPTTIDDHCFDERIERVRISSAVLMPPDVVISVPLFVGDTWGYERNDGSSVQRTVVGEQSVTVPLGTFEAARVRWVVTRNGQTEIEADAYWADGVGLIKIEGQFSDSDWLQELVAFDPP
jgi:hypothetical protein